MRRPARLQQRLLAFGACALAAGATAAAVGADTPSSLRERADALRRANVSLSARSHQALLDLYSLDAQLARAESRVEALRAQAVRIRNERAAVRRDLAVAQSSLRVSQRQLALRLRALYEQGGTDPLAVVLGATSLDEAITSLDDLSRTAALDRRVVAQTRHARASLAHVSRKLAARDAQIQSLAAAAESSLASLRAARAERSRFVAGLASQRRLNGTQISQLEAHASASVARSAVVVAAPAPGGSAGAMPIDAPGLGGRAITVSSTGYALRGTTASGMPVGWGVVAVDPSVIPLGTRMTIPGYGEGVAADTGSAVHGAIIDLWFPSTAQAIAWGRRTVTITLH